MRWRRRLPSASQLLELAEHVAADEPDAAWELVEAAVRRWGAGQHVLPPALITSPSLAGMLTAARGRALLERGRGRPTERAWELDAVPPSEPREPAVRPPPVLDREVHLGYHFFAILTAPGAIDASDEPGEVAYYGHQLALVQRDKIVVKSSDGFETRIRIWVLAEDPGPSADHDIGHVTEGFVEVKSNALRLRDWEHAPIGQISIEPGGYRFRMEQLCVSDHEEILALAFWPGDTRWPRINGVPLPAPPVDLSGPRVLSVDGESPVLPSSAFEDLRRAPSDRVDDVHAALCAYALGMPHTAAAALYRVVETQRDHHRLVGQPEVLALLAFIEHERGRPDHAEAIAADPRLDLRRVWWRPARRPLYNAEFAARVAPQARRPCLLVALKAAIVDHVIGDAPVAPVRELAAHLLDALVD